MPGLLRGMARTAVVAGTATAVRGRVARRQAEHFADRDAQIYAERQRAYRQQTQQPPADAAPAEDDVTQQPPPAAAPAESDVIAQLERLAKLKEQGILTDEEFAAQKARILGS